MLTASIQSILDIFKHDYGIVLIKLPRKKIIYTGYTKNNAPIVVVMPASTIYPRGHGWVDFTKIQIDTFKQYSIAIAVFRLSDGSTYYVDLERLYPLLSEENMAVNEREGEHWKIDIWPDKLVLKYGGKTLYVRPNEKSFLKDLL